MQTYPHYPHRPKVIHIFRYLSTKMQMLSTLRLVVNIAQRQNDEK